MVPLGTGSDGGGSIRLPASICGITALKASQGRIPLGGDKPPGAGVLAVRGPMALRARDVSYAMATCVGPDPSDAFSLPAADLDWEIPDAIDLPPRVVWAPTPVASYAIDSGVAAACDSAVRRLEAAGTEVIVVDKLVTGNPLADWYVLWTALRDRAQGELRGTPEWEKIDPGLRWDMDFAHEHVDATGVLRALDSIHFHNRDISAALEHAPIILTPTLASETALCGRLGTIDGVETAQWAPFTQLFNLTRHPAGTVPAGTTAAGLPVGIQVVGPHHADVEVLRALAALEDLWVDRSSTPFPAW
jgi:Asp-tRNA(Asn)/Glu-tRNA(Gln) amidotransferase A subunit family amidase